MGVLCAPIPPSECQENITNLLTGGGKREDTPQKREGVMCVFPTETAIFS